MLELIIIFLGTAADQAAKLGIEKLLPVVGDGRPVIPGFIGLQRVNNSGAAFGMLGNGTLLLTIVSALAIIVLGFVLVRYRASLTKLARIGLALIIAGGAGNLIDRIALGYVVDFIHLEFMEFPCFNVADCCACVGTALLVLALILGERKKAEKPEEK